MKSRAKKKKRKGKRRRPNRDEDLRQFGHDTPPLSSDDGWPSVFKKRRDIPLNVENESYIQSRERLGEDVPDDMIQIFMRGPSDPFGRLPRAAKLEEFCSDISLDYLRAAEHNEDGSLRVVAWLDDRSSETESTLARTRCKPLTAYGLFLELVKCRFPGAQSTISTTGTSSHDQAGDQRASLHGEFPCLPQSQSLNLDADRRLIFITDLDCCSISALIRTASPHQAPVLREALYNHVTFNASLEMTASIDRSPSFELAFHLPFFALKMSTNKQGDHRRNKNGVTMRRSYNVSFLDGPATKCSAWIHEAKISCIVAGSDESRWVAYFFVDTYYFDQNDEDREDVSEYNTDARDSGMYADPLTYGLADADKPIWDPRIYFLTVFAHRLSQVRREWERVVMKLEQSILAFEEVYDSRKFKSPPYDLSQNKENELNLQYSLDWVLNTVRLLELLKEVMSKTIKAYEPFCSKCEIPSGGSLRFPKGNILLPGVQKTFNVLRQLQETLEYLVKSCGQYAKELESRLNLKAVEVSTEQLRFTTKTMVVSNQQLRLSIDALELGKESKGFSWIMMIYISPIALTASMFSMEPTVIPFVHPTFGWFVALIGIFSFMGLVVHTTWFRRWREVTFGTWRYMLQLSRMKNVLDDPEHSCIIGASAVSGEVNNLADPGNQSLPT